MNDPELLKRVMITMEADTVAKLMLGVQPLDAGPLAKLFGDGPDSLRLAEQGFNPVSAMELLWTKETEK